MRVNKLLELIEPQVQNKNYRGTFKPSWGSAKDALGMGHFSTVQPDKNDPHMVKKLSSNPEDSKSDAYWDYAKIIAKDKLWENPYFPRLYNITQVKDKRGEVRFRAKMEKLEELSSALNNDESVDALARKIFGHEPEELGISSDESAYAKFTYIEREIAAFVRTGDFGTGGGLRFDQIDKSEIDPYFIDAATKLKNMSLEHSWVIDLRRDNMMARRGSYGIQLVFTDPFGFKN